MDLSEIVLVVLVILLVYSLNNYFVSGSNKQNEAERLRRKSAILTKRLNDIQARLAASEQVALPPPRAVETSANNADKAEAMSTGEHIESFSVCGGVDNETDRAVDCLCGDNPDITFSVHEFGAPGMDYKAFTATQELDPEVVKNHGEFVAERQGMTGRTFTPDSHDSYDPIPWIGLRRPEYVKMCNPTQVPDVDVNLYKGNRQFCFKT